MTEFEQQVAEALRTITFSGGTAGMVALPLDDEHINRLAPRVAAAIKAAGRAGEMLEKENVDDVEADALAALRGES